MRLSFYMLIFSTNYTQDKREIRKEKKVNYTLILRPYTNLSYFLQLHYRETP